MARRRAVRLAKGALVSTLYLGGGLALTILLAWGCWLLPRYGLDQRVNVPLRAWPWWMEIDGPEPATTHVSWNAFLTLTVTESADRVYNAYLGRAIAATDLSEWRAGFPLRTLCILSYNDNRRPPPNWWVEKTSGTIVGPVWLLSRLGVNELPARPLFGGLFVNTILYAGLLWVLPRTPGYLRRRSRRRRGLCERCAYPRGVSDVCTECGATLPAVHLRRAAS